MTKQLPLRFLGLLFIFILVIPLSLSPTNTVVEAQGLVQARVIPDNLIVRERPGINARSLGVVSRNTMIAVEGREELAGNGGVWVYGSPVEGGFKGWMLSDYLAFPVGFTMESLPLLDLSGSAVSSGGGSETPAIEVPAGALGGSTRNAINFRSGPSTSTRAIRVLPANTPVIFVARSNNNSWLKAQVAGQEGWLFASLVNVSGDINSLPVEQTEFDQAATSGTTSSNVNVPAPQYSTANLRTFSYGAHVADFNNPSLMSYARMTWAKRQIRFSVGDNPDNYAGMINDAHAKGFRILLGVVGQKNDVTGGDAYFNAYASFVAGLARLGADAIEIWNEPNIDREWATGYINPATYTQLLATSYNAIKGSNPGTIVISGAPAPTGAEGAFGRGSVWNDDAFLQGMRSAGAASYMDCLGAHYNEGIVSPRQTSGDPRGNYYTRYYSTMVNTYYNIMRKPICFTELGYLSPEGFGPLPANFAWASNVTVGQQAEWLADVIRLARGDSRVRLVIIWNMDFTGYGDDPVGGYAIIRPGGGCPACDRLARQ